MNKSKKSLKNNKGITLISLVVTIIVLIILAGISINLLLGENGIISKSKDASEEYNRQAATEKLELVLTELQICRDTDRNYNTGEYIDNKLIENGMIVSGNIVFVDQWQFEIDRNMLRILTSLGNGEKNEQIQIVLDSINSNDYAKSTVRIEILHEKEIVSVIFDGNNIEVPEKQEEKYVIEKDVTSNGIYSVIVKDETNNYNIATIEVKDLTENLDIYTKDELIEFRNEVNSGRSFEGKVVTLKSDIILNEEKYSIIDGKALFDSSAEQWSMINSFSGTFDGNGHKIKGIYINTNTQQVGMFHTITEKGKVKNLIIEDSYFYIMNNGGGYAGILACDNYGEIYRCGISNTNSIKGESVGTVHNWPGVVVAGFVSTNNGIIKECYNSADATSIKGFGNVARSAGIAIFNNGTIVDSYNTGKIVTIGASAYYNGGICACDYGSILNCYNIGEISNISPYLNGAINYGGIAGGTSDSSRVYRLYNNFYLNDKFTNAAAGNKNRETSILGTADTTRSDVYGLNESQFLGIEQIDEKDILELLNTRETKNTRSMDKK